MAVSFFPFNSIVVNGVADRAANAENLAAYLAGFFSDGVIMQSNTALQVAVDSGMNLQILAGTGNIKGKTILNTTAASITIEAASATLKRIDRVIFRLDENNRLMEFGVLKGTAASSPAAPALTRSGGIYEMCLAEVLVPAGATSILASYITDTRNDSSMCGIASIPPHMQDIAHGGTGATTAAAARSNIGVKKCGTYNTLPVASGGTGKTTATEALAALGGVSIKKMWSNASPASTFNNQTISLSLSGYAYVDVTYRAQNDKASEYTTRIPVGGSADGGGIGSVSVYRPTSVSTAGVTFGQGRCYASYNASSITQSGNYGIPVAIYGIKGVS